MVKAFAVSAAAAAVVTAVAMAAGARSPMQLAIGKSALPAGTHGSAQAQSAYSLSPLGVKGLKGASYVWSWPVGGTVSVPLAGPTEKELHLEGNVFVAPAKTAAKQLFALGKRAQVGLFSDVPSDPRYVVPTKLRAYGEEQLSYLTTEPISGIHAVVFVRKGTVVWQMRIGPSPRQFRVTRAQMLAALNTYAAKQRALVGAG